MTDQEARRRARRGVALDRSTLCAGLTEQEWKTETECPGWSVQDNVAHLIGIESTILGEPRARPHPARLAARQERHRPLATRSAVDSRRGRIGRRRCSTSSARSPAERIEQLRGMTDDDFVGRVVDAGGSGHRPRPAAVPHLRLVGARAGHAAGRSAVPAHVDGPAAELALGRVVGRAAVRRGEEGGAARRHDRRVRLGRQHHRHQVMDGGRAKPLDAPPADPTVRLTMDTETLVRLGMGRGDPAEILAGGAVRSTATRRSGAASSGDELHVLISGPPGVGRTQLEARGRAAWSSASRRRPPSR